MSHEALVEILVALRAAGADFVLPTEWGGEITRFREEWDAGGQPQPVPQLLVHQVHGLPQASLALAQAEHDAGVTAVWSVIEDQRLSRAWHDDPEAWEALRRIRALGHELALHVDPERIARRGEDVHDVLAAAAERFRANGLEVRAADAHGETEFGRDAFLAGLDESQAVDTWLAPQAVIGGESVESQFAVRATPGRTVIESVDPPYVMVDAPAEITDDALRGTLSDLAARVVAVWRVSGD